MQPTTPFPDIKFWNQKSRRVEFINGEDFWVDELIKNLGLTKHPLRFTMGSSDREEIISRQEIMKILSENLELRDFLKKEINGEISIGQNFLDDFHPEKPKSEFMKDIHRLIDMLEKIDIKKPLIGKLATFYQFLKSTEESMNTLEHEFGKKAGSHFEKTSNLQGRTTLEIDFDFEGKKGEGFNIPLREAEEGYGYRHYSFKFSDRFKLKLNPDSEYWKNNKAWWWVLAVLSIIFFPIGIWILFHNAKTMKMAYKPMIIDEVPMAVKADICAALNKLLIQQPELWKREALEERSRLFAESRDENDPVEKGKKKIIAEAYKIPPTLELSKKVRNDTRVFVEVYYQYRYDGLKIRILKIYARSKKHDKDEVNMDRGLDFDSSFKGYSKAYKKKIRERSNKLQIDAFKQFQSHRAVFEVINFIEYATPELIDRNISIPSPVTDHDNISYTAEQVFNLPDVRPYYEAVKKYRVYVCDLLDQLQHMSSMIEIVVKKSAKWSIPIEFPAILTDEQHVIGFETIYPIHLIGRTSPDQKIVKPDDLVPINSLPPLNGQIIGLTGQNGGGKTATITEWSYLVYMAQSGLPVFGKGVHLNVKETIGLVFNTRSQGSQLQNFLTKSMKVLESIQANKLSTNKTVVFLDELGSGAQNEDGIDIGKKILRALHHSGVSTVYNTQLPEVAQYSESELDAVCYKFDLEHQATKGIGAGNAEALARQIGIDKFFVTEI